MSEMLLLLPVGKAALLAVLLLGGLALRRWGPGRAAMVGAGMVGLAFIAAVAWVVSSVTLALQMIRT